ncbi:hypothetical protein [Wielerella bovis]|uniref:hypothetical protein n=1 Tax=Wielerella bovis TaxID=2917790 RepID=UPI002019B80B|nr:hypothetical protein [Wielerella bovis]ULJ59818.1 hypothetical protein MIS44_09065 [Wielerella bovis]
MANPIDFAVYFLFLRLFCHRLRFSLPRHLERQILGHFWHILPTVGVGERVAAWRECGV